MGWGGRAGTQTYFWWTWSSAEAGGVRGMQERTRDACWEGQDGQGQLGKEGALGFPRDTYVLLGRIPWLLKSPGSSPLQREPLMFSLRTTRCAQR